MTIWQKIIQLNNELGYSNKSGGICLGFSMLWLEAQILGQEKQFIERAQRIAHMADDPDRIKKFNQIKNKKGTRLTSEESELFNILAFYDGLELYHSPDNHSDLFNTPHELKQAHFETISTFAAADDIQDLGGLQTLYKENLAYKTNEIETYLNDLGAILEPAQQSQSSPEPIGFLLTSCDEKPHAIAMTYQGKKEGKYFWKFMDPGIITDLSRHITEGDSALISTGFDIAFRYNWHLDLPVLFHIELITTRNRVYNTTLTDTLNTFKQRAWPKEMYQREGLAHLAAFYGDTNLIQALYKHKVPLDTMREIGRIDTLPLRGPLEKQKKETPASLAAHNGYADVIDTLVSLGVSMTSKVLVAAMINDQPQVISALHKHGIVDCMSYAEDGTTALWKAAAKNFVSTVNTLVSWGADVNQMTKAGVTPLFIAAQCGHTEVVQALLASNADGSLPYITSTESLNAFAAYTKDPAIIIRMQAFLDKIDPSIDHNHIPMQARDIATVMGHQDITHLLFDSDKRELIEATQNNNCTKGYDAGSPDLEPKIMPLINLDIIKSLTPQEIAEVCESAGVRQQIIEQLKTLENLVNLSMELSPEKLSAFLQANRDNVLQVFIQSPEDISDLLIKLDIKKCNIFLGAMKQSLPDIIRLPKHLVLVLAPLSPEQRTAVYDAMKGELLKLIKSSSELKTAEAFRTVLEYLGLDQRTAVYDAMKGGLPNLIQNYFAFRAVLEYLSPEQCASVCDAMKGNLSKVIKNATEFTRVLINLSPEQCASVCDVMKSDLHKIITSEKDFSMLMKYLSLEQAVEVYETLLVNPVENFNLNEAVNQLPVDKKNAIQKNDILIKQSNIAFKKELSLIITDDNNNGNDVTPRDTLNS